MLAAISRLHNGTGQWRLKQELEIGLTISTSFSFIYYVKFLFFFLGTNTLFLSLGLASLDRGLNFGWLNTLVLLLRNLLFVSDFVYANFS